MSMHIYKHTKLLLFLKLPIFSFSLQDRTTNHELKFLVELKFVLKKPRD